MDVRLCPVIHGNELQSIDKEGLFKLVRDAQLIATVARLQLISGDTDVLIGIRLIPHDGANQPPISPAHEVGHELEARAVP